MWGHELARYKLIQFMCLTSIGIFLKMLKIIFIYLFMRDPEREAETQAEGEAGSLRGAQCRTGSRDPGVTP